jgi:copper homeostasis protein CutC
LNKSQNQIDVNSLKDLVEASRPYPVVFHKAIDVIPEGNLHHAITVLNSFKVDRVLTSGLAKTAIEG